MISNAPYCKYCNSSDINKTGINFYPGDETYTCQVCGDISSFQEYTYHPAICDIITYYWDNNNSSDWAEILIMNNCSFIKYINDSTHQDYMPRNIILPTEIQLLIKLA